MTPDRGPRRVLSRRSALTLLVALGAAGCATDRQAGIAGASRPASPAPTGSAPSESTPSASAPASPDPTSSARSGPRPIPAGTTSVSRLECPAIGIDTDDLEELHLLADGTLAAPHDPDRAGWYVDGPVPGDRGPAVIAGHVDSRTGPAVFARLGDSRSGQAVRVTLSDGRSHRFVVDRTALYPQDAFPTDEVYAPVPDVQLRLITCGGSYDPGRGYRDNVVVFLSAV